MTARVWPVDAVPSAPAYSGRSLRQSSLAPFLAGASATRPLGAVSGVRPGTSSTTVEATSTTWTVHPLAGIADVETAAEAGPYGWAFDADTAGSLNAAHASLTRWDGIYVCIDDPAESDGSSVPAARIVYVAGNANATPANGEPGAVSGPSVPARSIHIARIVVPQSGGGSPSVVQLAPVCAAAGGIFLNPPTDQQAALNAIATPSNPVWIDAQGVLKRSSGSGFAASVWTRRGATANATTTTIATSPSWTTVATLTTPAQTGILDVAGMVLLVNANSGVDRRASVQLLIDASPHAVALSGIDLRYVSGQSVGHVVSFIWPVTGLSVGSHTLALQVQASGANSVQAVAASLRIAEVPS